MKNIKPISFFLCISIIISAFSFSAIASTPKYGDLNDDNKVTSTDSLMALQIGTGKRISTEYYNLVGDVDGNKIVNSTDALLILQYSVGLIDKFPIEKKPTPVPGDLGVVDIPVISDDKTATTLSKAYGTYRDGYELKDGDIYSLYQVSGGFSGGLAVDTDCVMLYCNSASRSDTFYSDWEENIKKTNDGDTVLGLMMPANRDSGDYEKAYGLGDAQTYSNGDVVRHPGGMCYMCPTQSYIEYKWGELEKIITKFDCKIVSLEEPEYWNACGFGAGYKQEWKNYFGTDWINPNSSNEAYYLHQQFRCYLFTRELKYIGEKIKEYNSDIKFLVASHSTYSYASIGIVTGMSSYTNLDCVDGIIGQTWTNTVSTSVPYCGSMSVHPFANALFDYSSYYGIVPEGKSVYLLQDPSGDDSRISSEEYEKIWKSTVVASLLQKDTDRFQNIIWPDRSYGTASMEKKTLELNVNKLLTAQGQDVNIYSGTPGVYIGLSDSIGWQSGKGKLTYSSLESAYAIGMSLIYDGIPVNSIDIDHLNDVSDLEKVNLLILSYDCQKPQNEKTNEVIAKWINQGGRVLYVGGNDSLTSELKNSWWSKNGTNPLQDLLDKTGLDITASCGYVSAGTVPSWASAGSPFAAITNNMTWSFSGEANTFMTASTNSIAIEQNVGKGKIVVCGLSSNYFNTNFNTEKILRALVKKTLQGSNHEYYSCMNLCSKYGNYYAYYNLSNKTYTAANSTMIDLFSPSLELLKGGTMISAAEPHLYYDVTDKIVENCPCIGFSNGVECAENIEEQNKTVICATAPSGSLFSTRLLCNGKFVQNISAVDSEGGKASIITQYDDTYSSILVQISVLDNSKPVTVTVEWGDNYKPLDTDYKFTQMYVRTNKDNYNNGKDFLIYDHTILMNSDCYYGDGDTYATFRIDLSKYKNASLNMSIRANYVVSVSFDNESWTEVVNWSDSHDYYPNGDNGTDIAISSQNYSQSKTSQYMYVKLGSCYMSNPLDPSQPHPSNPGRGWGGAIVGYTLSYLQPVI